MLAIRNFGAGSRIADSELLMRPRRRERQSGVTACLPSNGAELATNSVDMATDGVDLAINGTDLVTDGALLVTVASRLLSS